MLEIERKYLVCRDDYLREASHHRHIRQGYLTVDERVTVRVRIIDEAQFLQMIEQQKRPETTDD